MAIDPTSPRTRRALLGAGLGAIAATAASALGSSGIADATSSVVLGGTNIETTPTIIRNTAASTAAVAISGRVTHATGSTTSAGLQGQDDGINGTGVIGYATNGATARGVYGQTTAGRGVEGASATGIGVYGHSTSAAGVRGNSTSGIGVLGASNSGYGVWGDSPAGGVYGHSTNGNGVRGTSTNDDGVYGSGGYSGVSADGGSYGVVGYGGPTGVYGSGATQGLYGSGNTYGLLAYGSSYGAFGHGYVGVQGQSASYGVVGVNTSLNGDGVQGTGGQYGVHGTSGYTAGVRGESDYVGAWGQALTFGVYGLATDTDGTHQTYGVYGEATNAISFGLWSNGNAHIAGTLSKVAGSFKIDHPLDPERKWLSHSFVESPDMMNVYNGTAVLDATGAATVRLPKYFGALNRDYRYQLTPMGGPAPSLHIAQEVKTNAFRIAGGAPGQKVSWQVTGIRQDDYAKERPIVVETTKSKVERGTRQFVPRGSTARLMVVGPVQPKGHQPPLPTHVPHEVKPRRA